MLMLLNFIRVDGQEWENCEVGKSIEYWNEEGLQKMVVLVVKTLPANARDTRDMGSNPGWGRSPGGGNGNPLQYSCLGNSMDKGTWQATVQGVAKSWT